MATESTEKQTHFIRRFTPPLPIWWHAHLHLSLPGVGPTAHHFRGRHGVANDVGQQKERKCKRSSSLGPRRAKKIVLQWKVLMVDKI